MTRPSATPPEKNRLPANTAAGTVLLEVAAAGADGGSPPEMIKVTPVGQVETRDGRKYSFDPAMLSARFAKDGVDIPVDVDHGISKKAMWGERADAVGWVKELVARDDGLYARIEWLEAGREILSAKTHRYVSPTFRHNDLGEAQWLHSIALVAAPALALPAVAAANPAMETSMDTFKKIAAALGLGEAADEAACLSAIADLQASKVDNAVHDETLATLSATKTELTELKASIRDDEVETLIEGALKAKKIVPAQREQYVALCATDDGLAQVKALLEVTPEGLPGSGLDTKTPAGDDTEIDPAALAAEARTHMADLAAKGITISIAEAVAAVKEKRA